MSHYYVFASHYHHTYDTRAIMIIPESRVPGNFRTSPRFEQWELVYDSARSREHALRLLNDGIYIGSDDKIIVGGEKPCSACGAYLPVNLVRAKRWTDAQSASQQGKIVPFYGNLCEPCSDDMNFSDIRSVSSMKG